jgi:hypothetical protein
MKAVLIAMAIGALLAVAARSTAAAQRDGPPLFPPAGQRPVAGVPLGGQTQGIVHQLVQLGPLTARVQAEAADGPIRAAKAKRAPHGHGLARPLGPRTPKISPPLTESDTSSTATACP